jgi:hypothetical protein
VADALKWDGSQIDPFLRDLALTIDKVDAAISALGYVCVKPRVLEAMAAVPGAANCECARRGMGECGGGNDGYDPDGGKSRLTVLAYQAAHP